MANPYSKYTGSKISPVPAGYLAAAAQSAEGVRKSGEKFGDMIGAGIAKYYEGKQEDRAQEAHDKYLGQRDMPIGIDPWEEAQGDEEPSESYRGEPYLQPLAETPSARRGLTPPPSQSPPLAETPSARRGLTPPPSQSQPLGAEQEQPGMPTELSVPPAPVAPAPAYLPQEPEAEAAAQPTERYIPTLKERLAYGQDAFIEHITNAKGISRKQKAVMYADHERWIDRTTNQHNADRLHKLRVATEGRLGATTVGKPSALTEKFTKLEEMAKAADSRGTPWTAEELEEHELEILDIAGAATSATAKVAEWATFQKTERWAGASPVKKLEMTERFFDVGPLAGDKTTLQKNILEFNNKLLAMKAGGAWTEKGEAQLRGDYGLTSKAEIDLQDVTLQLKKRDLEEGDWEFDPVVITLRDEAGNKLPYGFIQTSREAGMYVQMNPGIGMDKSNFSIDANRLATMMKQYAASFSYKDDLGDLITRDMKTASPQELATIDATAMLIMGMQRNMGLKVSSYPSVVNPTGPPLKPALPAPKDKKEVEGRQNTREKTEDKQKRDAMDALNNRGAPNPNARKR